MSGSLGRELLEVLGACLIAALIGVSFYFDVRVAFDVKLGEAVALCLQAFLVHDLAHKLSARGLASRGRFRLSPVGAFFSLFIAGISNLSSLAFITVKRALGLSLAGAWRLAPYRMITPGSVVVSGRRRKVELGKVAATGPIASISLSWALLASACLLEASRLRELLLLASALNAYTALSNLLPLAFCDGLAIYWWSRGAWLILLANTIALMAITNLALFLGLP